VDRLAGETGFCGIGAGVPVSFAGLHFGEEPPISGNRGSGTIFIIGCNLNCVFCQNYQISQEFSGSPFETLSVDELAAQMLLLQHQGAHNINFVSPTHVVFYMAEAIRMARELGLTIPIVYNSNGYDSVDALRQIRGLVDIYLPDIKYQDDALAKRYSKAPDYPDVVIDVLREMFDQVGLLETDAQGVATRGVLVRHLVLPGHPENSRRCLDVLEKLSPKMFVSIMSQYSPRYKACDYPEIARPLTPDEYDAITDHALHLGLENAFVQELESQGHYLPDFDRKQPFND
jgi:putative pyruvate formate lyase activating enzyme